MVTSTQLNGMANQIRNAGSCAVLNLAMETNLISTQKLIADIELQRLKIAELFLPLLEIPKDLGAVIKWIENSIKSSAGQQLKAYIEYAIEMIKLAAALQNLNEAVSEALERLPDCVLNEINSGINTLKSEVDAQIFSSLDEIKQLQYKIQNLIPDAELQLIETGNVQDFLSSINERE